ncbi:N-methyl-L-tryptophan oxidase [Spirosoma aureum]|uniref:N-methyl-L-tryptophan oxidase n=1 Tax=Spirosoma aureum TaxID=2692134 RepID=A0A6G9AU74_9BACT|nr:N-methyl-L-tryptophan oxidase [Spirosoma aureum]QIP15763.1 N-methyl-L-tryptophan oxidase [Spirosoma aureum]
MIFDAIVVGLGAVGSATLYQLAKQTPHVLGLDQFSPPHTMGSTHGDTRITRQAIGEGAYFVPLALRSYEIWQELEELTEQQLLTKTGGLFIGKEQSAVQTHNKPGWLTNTIEAAEQFGITHQILDKTSLRDQYPQFRFRDDDIGYYEPDAGFLKPELCVSAHLDQARINGASIRTNERMLSFTETATGVTVRTNLGEYTAKKLVLTTGSWVTASLYDTPYRNLLTVYRQVQYWFDVHENHAAFTSDHFPVFILSDLDVYGFPAIGSPSEGIKIAMETYAKSTTPDAVNRVVSEAETRSMYDQYIAPNFSGIGPKCIKSAVCLYTMTPNGDFVIDNHPNYQHVLVASACSGHGFKHSAAVGQVLAELALQNRTDFDLTSFRLDRFAV